MEQSIDEKEGNSNVVSAESRHRVVRSVYLHTYTHAVYLCTPPVLRICNNGALFPRFLSTLCGGNKLAHRNMPERVCKDHEQSQGRNGDIEGKWERYRFMVCVGDRLEESERLFLGLITGLCSS
jgi:hypothetical protein